MKNLKNKLIIIIILVLGFSINSVESYYSGSDCGLGTASWDMTPINCGGTDYCISSMECCIGGSVRYGGDCFPPPPAPVCDDSCWGCGYTNDCNRYCYCPPPPPPPPPATCSSFYTNGENVDSCNNGYTRCGWYNDPRYPYLCAYQMSTDDCNRCKGSQLTDGSDNDPRYCGDGHCIGETCSNSQNVNNGPCMNDCGVCNYCGDGSCNGGETCSTCSNDCGRCKPAMDPWCDSNCYTDNACQNQYILECGTGWESYSKMCCTSLPPKGSGLTCGDSGACKAEYQCNNGILEPNENCVSCPQDSPCSTGQVCNSATTACVTDPCNTCSVTQSCVRNPSNPADITCQAKIETCFDGIDNNGDGNIDEGCGGCADLDSDGTVGFDDFFLLADNVELTEASCAGNVDCLILLSKLDWEDDNSVDIVPPALINAQTNIANFNGDAFVNMDDFNILTSEFGRTGSNLFADLDNDGDVDLDDFFIFVDQFGTTVVLHDYRCFAQNFERVPQVGCTQQICESRTNGEECYSSSQCYSFHCSIVDKDAQDNILRIGKKGELGHCCPSDHTWNTGTGTCVETILDPCNCQYSPLNPSFWNTAGCLDVVNQWACVKTKVLGNEEKLTIEIIKR